MVEVRFLVTEGNECVARGEKFMMTGENKRRGEVSPMIGDVCVRTNGRRKLCGSEERHVAGKSFVNPFSFFLSYPHFFLVCFLLP